MVRVAYLPGTLLRGRIGLSRRAVARIAPNPVTRVVHVLQQRRTSLGISDNAIWSFVKRVELVAVDAQKIELALLQRGLQRLFQLS